MWAPGPGLNLRPCSRELRQALHELAKGEGLKLYAYVFAVLEQHVQERRRPSTEAVTSSAWERTSA